MNDRIARLERRIESLTKEKNAAMEALELASSLGTFDTGMGRCAESGDVIHELLRRVVDMLDFRYSGILLINDQTQDFQMAQVHPQDSGTILEWEAEGLIADGSFAWALRQTGPVFFLSSDRKHEILLHVLTTRTRIWGMFVGLLGSDRAEIPDTTLALLSVVFSSAAHALENCRLQHRLARINRNLEARIEKRTRDLQEANAQMNTIIQAVPAGIVLVDAETRSVAQVNNTALEMLGLRPEDTIGKPCHERFCEGHQDCCPCLEGRPCEKGCDRTIRTADGRTLHIMRSTVPVTLGGRRYLLDSFVDITEHKKLAKLREDVDQITRHDLKTPLNGVIALPDIILGRWDVKDEEIRSILRMIKEAGLKMLRMINLSHDLFKMETGKYQYHPENVNVGPILRSILAELEDLRHAKRVTVKIQADNEPYNERIPFVLLGEELLVYSMLSNLLKNAIEAAPRQSEVNIRMYSGPPATIAIHNLGIVPEKLREHFFEKFATLGKKGGSGLGTYSAMLIAKTMGGNLSFTTSEEQGTTLTVELPGEPSP